MIFKNHVSRLGEYCVSEIWKVDYDRCSIIVGREEGQVTASCGGVCGPKAHSGKMAYTDYQGQRLFPLLHLR